MKRGKVVVVTGAGGGVGRATARAFAEGGARVAPAARGREGLAAAADEVQQAGGEALVVSVDMADSKAVDDAAQQVVDAFGHIDVRVNNAFRRPCPAARRTGCPGTGDACSWPPRPVGWAPR